MLVSTGHAAAFLWCFQEFMHAAQTVLCVLLREDVHPVLCVLLREDVYPPHRTPKDPRLTNTLTGSKWPGGYCERVQLSFSVGISDQVLPSR